MRTPTEAIEDLWQARQHGDCCPAWLVGSISLDEALDIQLGLLDRHLRLGAQLGGWKVGLTSPRARSMLGADVRPFGYVLADRVIPSGATLDTSLMRKPAIEAELCFTIGARLEGTAVSREEVFAGLAAVSAGFEINERRPGSARADLGAMVTDCLTNWAIVHGASTPIGPDTATGIGTSLTSPDQLNDIAVRLTCDGETMWQGVSRDELDDHVTSLQRLVANLTAHGRALEAGQRVITGAYCRFDARPGQHWRATYEPMGDVEVRFT